MTDAKPRTPRPRYGIRFADGETSWVGTVEECLARMGDLWELAAKGVVRPETIAGMQLVGPGNTIVLTVTQPIPN